MARLLLFLLLAVLLAACAAVPQEEVTGTPAQVTLDEQLIEINKRIPGFGGMYVDEKGVVNVYLADTERLDAKARQGTQAKIEQALTEVLGPDALSSRSRTVLEREAPIKRPPTIRLVKGEYSIQQLTEWRSRMESALQVPGVVFTDLDERSNRLKIGIEPGASREKVEEALEKADIPPPDAVIIEETQPIYFHKSLRDKFRSMPGGVQVEADTAWLGYSICTMGFNAIRAGVSGFVTNSHCTKKQGGNQGTDFHQPDDPWWTEGNKVGDEIADPAYFTGGVCPSGRRCRYSDSAFIDYTISRGSNIARTTGWNNGSLNIHSTRTRLTIVGEMSAWVDGSELDKIGRTSGWSYGHVEGTCQNINVAQTDITLLCQYRVNRLPDRTYTMSDFGDSGSPVFRWQGDTVVLSGILWGGTTNGSTFVFSPMSQIEQELGALTTFDFPQPQPPSGGGLCPTGQKCCETELINNKPVCVFCRPQWQACP